MTGKLGFLLRKQFRIAFSELIQQMFCFLKSTKMQNAFEDVCESIQTVPVVYGHPFCARTSRERVRTEETLPTALLQRTSAPREVKAPPRSPGHSPLQ
jgi:hypothetical protein